MKKNQSNLWRRFSRKLRESFSKGIYIRCYTCPSTIPIDSMDTGHFIPRGFLGTKYDIRNNKPQCKQCNRYKHGNLKVFERELIKEYGPEIIEELNLKKNDPLPTEDEIFAQF